MDLGMSPLANSYLKKSN
ncbi:hypothetical protein JTT01_20405 [Clostridium botulinum]|nr:hypothetical protein [Clostridium botulinum]